MPQALVRPYGARRERVVAPLDEYPARTDPLGRRHVTKRITDDDRTGKVDRGMVPLRLDKEPDSGLPALTGPTRVWTAIDAVQPRSSRSELSSQRGMDAIKVREADAAQGNTTLVCDYEHRYPLLVEDSYSLRRTL
jgi:hypothetical protein